MLKILGALILLLQSTSYAQTRNLGIVDHPRYKYMQAHQNATGAKKKTVQNSSARYFKKTHILTLDTRDQVVCQHYADTLKRSGSLRHNETVDLCATDPQNPYISIAIESPAPHSYGWRFSDLSPREQELTRQTRNFFVPAVGMMALLFALPKSFTGWDSFDAQNLGEKWKSNVKAGPVMDEDKWVVNYIGHPYAGAAYYVVARHAGFTKTESFVYSAFMSAFFWEYGIESFAEVPSIQDLILTPVLGAFLGEFFVQGAKKIRSQNNEVLGSKVLGATSLFLMDPAGGILEASDRLMSKTPFSDAEFQVYTKPSTTTRESRVGFNLVLWLKKK